MLMWSGATSIFDSLFYGHMGRVRDRSFLLVAWLAAHEFLYPYIAGAGGGVKGWQVPLHPPLLS